MGNKDSAGWLIDETGGVIFYPVDGCAFRTAAVSGMMGLGLQFSLTQHGSQVVVQQLFLPKAVAEELVKRLQAELALLVAPSTAH